jgi:hypothetical protein
MALVLGVLGTSTIHLSKAVMKQGLLRVRAADAGQRSRARTIYAAGIVMNFTNPVWVIAANRFAPTVYYTSMYGVGLVALLLYAEWRLGERLGAGQKLGIGIIIVATLVIGLSGLRTRAPSLHGASLPVAVLVSGGWLVVAPLGALVVRRARLSVREVVFGMGAGGLAALEAIIKGVSQAGPESSTFLPQSQIAWVLFVASFLGAAGAFGMIQWSFLWSCRASAMGAIYTTTYVALPLVVIPILVAGARLTAGAVAGVCLLAIGAIFTTIRPGRIG